MSKLLVMTDLHLTDGSKTIIGLDPFQRLRQGLDHALRNHPDADRLLLLGDLTHFGQTVSYQALRDALNDLPWPISFLLGNHDRRSTFRKVFPETPVDPNGFVQSAVDLDDVRLITLDSLDETANPAHSGILCDDRMAWLKAQLSEADRPCLVFVHHPPFESGFVGMDAIRLRNDRAFLDLIAQHNVSHVFAGHIHRTITAKAAGVPVTVFKSTCHQMPMLLGEAGSTHSVDEPGAYGIVLTNGPDCVVHFEDFGLPATTTASR
ncbi:MAG: phosphodiesterase [Paracoccaceae bacterium]|nr:phosphodiesterase [Paracoccaceae bacterium]